MNSFQIRQMFLDYFSRNGHTVVASSSLIPAQDPTLLFANAGMNQFKDIFLGKEKRSYTRATTVQKCVRAGGKHNDLDAVGFTERHLTFFEMLGNFSFGDYFKKEAITFAWEFLTKEVKLPKENMYVSIYKNDDEAYDLWHTMIGIPAERIIRLGEKDNFWQMGDTGPCGPCTEIYVDRGAGRGCQQPTCAPGCDCSRFTEIWNLVFMQYDRQANGELKPLKATGVDTGMGLERLCMVMHGKDNVYQSDVFTHLIGRIQALSGISYEKADANTKAAFHVLSDHVRSSSLLIADGCSPSNDGRGYVLRKIIRRAALFAQKLSPDVSLFPHLAETFIEFFKGVYPELETNKSLIINLLSQELVKFNTNLLQGQPILIKLLDEVKAQNSKLLPGSDIFKLYDTYGFPPELTRVIAYERGIGLDMEGFEKEMLKQQEQSGKKTKDAGQALIVTENVSTTFVGYETLSITSKVSFVSALDGYLWIITEESPFYVESGGQVNDNGALVIDGVSYPVVDLKKVGNVSHPAIAVKIAVDGKLSQKQIKVGDRIGCVVDEQSRANTAKNHTATHLLQAGLMTVLGPQVKQAGSLVCDAYARFDFTHHEAMTDAQIEAVEDFVNQKIMADIQTSIFETTLDKAREQGIIAFFGEKYNPERVRVIQVPGVSAELCGGTHIGRTGVIGCFKVISETALSSGTRRITLVTGPAALKLFQLSYTTVRRIGDDFKVKPEESYAAIQKLQQHYADAQSTIKKLKKQLFKTQAPTLVGRMSTIGSIPFLYAEFEDVTIDDIKVLAQEIETARPGFYFFVSKDASKRCNFFGYASKHYESQVPLKQLAQHLKDTWQWRGGGSASLIQGGGECVQDIETTLQSWIKENAAKNLK